ncbi:MAG TPA: nucleotidyl transferase AbiEii/AbiGii toxin family protein [Solirubrobacterales bacterium]|nr:nucleotidyl transferase AbiEii/AbiGii toxin family protein [Solirubrobacterales bacterium]
MIHPNLIKRKADEDGLSASVVERDYVLAHTLTAISKHDEQGQIVFKGGTALRLCHFEDYRYSADLDFSLVGGLGVDGALQLIADALVECEETIGFPIICLTDGIPPRIEYIGPLEAKPRRLKLDLADDELVEGTVTLPIARRYEDLASHRCLVYSLDEITAEKLRCVMQRLQCRDLYDLHELLVIHGVDAETVWPVFERKARHRNRDPGRFAARFENLTPEWERRWDRELMEYVLSPPHFDGALRAVRRELRFALR